MDLPLIFNCSALWSHDLSSNDAKTSRALGSRWLNYGATGQPGQTTFPHHSSSQEADSEESESFVIQIKNGFLSKQRKRKLVG